MPDTPSPLHRDARHWSREFTDPAILAAEHERLGHGTWQLLGLAVDVARDGDWFATRLSGRAVVVQRYGDAVVGFENLCPERFFPLRPGERGNGPLCCTRHGQEYDRDGSPIGKPDGRKLRRIEVGLCGGLVFGRLPAADDGGQSLAEYLGAAFVPVATLTTRFATPLGFFGQTVAANWKASFHLTLDDYHIVAVHPDTFGANGAVKDGWYRYFDLGRHSAMFVDQAGPAPDAWDIFAAECDAGIVSRNAYRIIQLFPNTTIVLCPVEEAWFTVVTDYQAGGPAETRTRFWLFGADDELGPDVAESIVALIRQVADEDAMTAEALQRGASQIWQQPALSRQEERIAWFDAAYAAVMRDG